jgi:hypothetical protein
MARKKKKKPAKIEDKKLSKEIWCVDTLVTLSKGAFLKETGVKSEDYCYNKIGVFTLSAPDSQEMNIAFALDDLFEFKPGKRYKLNIEEVPWDAEDQILSN